ncbi:MAG TPA: fibronectin type III domain-containing protein, partial [Acidimicrobiales bacterium]|nr:fibronectin type III domain-containing protein [Acidimicrobiales bacterium]
DSTPSVAVLGSGATDSVFVGTGDAMRPDIGGYEGFGPGGQQLWSTKVVDPPGDTHPAYGVQASLAVGYLQGGADVFAGSLDMMSYALDASSGSVLAGWPFFTADSVFSTAAVGDLYGTGQQELVVGGASTAGLAMGQAYSNGGHVRILSPQGNLMYDYDTTQEVDSSPAIGDFLAGAPGIVVGTGSFYPGASDTDTVKAFNTRLGLVWSQTLDGLTGSSPALADVLGSGGLEVVEGTDTGSGGSVWVLEGADGAVVWHEPVIGRVIGSVVAADLAGAGYEDLLVPTVHGVEVLDGRSGAQVTVLGPDLGFQNSPLVSDDPNGTVGITVAGYNGNNQGIVRHYEITGSNGALIGGAGSWPMFHHDPALSGASSVLPDLGRVTPTDLAAQAGNSQVSLSWSPPTGGPATGYNVYEATSPGHESGAPLNGTTPVAGTSYAVSGLTNGRRYDFEVTALNAAGEGAPSNEVSAVPAGPPGAPGAPSVTPGNGQVSLSWVAPASNGSAITGYNVYESTAEGTPGSKVATVAAPTTAYTVTGLSNGTTYYFQVTAVNGVGEGPYSAQVSTVPQASSTPASVPPGPPTNVSTTAGNMQVSLSWVAPASSGSSAITGYNVYESTAAGNQGAKIATVPAPTMSYTVAGLSDGTTYYFEVTAVNGTGEGIPSAQVAATPLAPPGYLMAASDGRVFPFGKVSSYVASTPTSPVVGIASTPDERGYWLAQSDGGLLAAGDAAMYGSMANYRLNKPVVGIAATPDGRGYWLAGSDGSVFAFGDVGFFGSLGAHGLNGVVVAMAR